MTGNRFYLFSLLVGIVCLLPARLRSADLVLQKGPILHIVQDKLQVRVQGAGLKDPKLEYRKGEGEPKDDSMSRDTFHFWEANLPKDAASYRVVDGENSTPWYEVRKQDEAKTFRFIAYGDNRAGWGDSEKIHRGLLANMAKESAAFVVNTGDLVYNGNREDFWDQLFAEGKTLFASVPFQPAIGNHDTSQKNLYNHYYDLGAQKQAYFFFEYGKAQFIVLDTTRNFAPNSRQYKFLVDQLEKSKGKSPVIVIFHHPAYSFSLHGSDRKVQAHLVPLFEKYGVDLVLTGHDHNYQRIGPVNGVTYIVTGGGGGPLYRVRKNPLLKNSKEVYHYVVLEVGEQSIRGTVKYRSDIAGETFEIPYRDNAESPSVER